MSRHTGPNPTIRRQVVDRDGGVCLRCGTRPGTNVHHRIGRGMGGSRRTDINSVAALVLLCGSGSTGCHGYLTTHPEVAYATGWCIRRSSADLPSEVPVHTLDGRTIYLLDDGSVVIHPTPSFYPADHADWVTPF